MTSAGGAVVRVAGVPALLRYAESPGAAAGRGTVLFYHGFGGTKEKPGSTTAPTALAEAGFLAVSLDAVGHGERRYPDFDVIFNDERWDASFEETETEFLRVIDETAAEIPAIMRLRRLSGFPGESRSFPLSLCFSPPLCHSVR